MRPIKFRAKTKANGHWVCGSIVDYGNGNFTIRGHGETWVVPETIGQFTGLYDKNGTEIYEGDIVVYGKHCRSIVEFKHGMFGYDTEFGFIGYGGNVNFTFNPEDRSNRHEVIGNIHDNPELVPKMESEP